MRIAGFNLGTRFTMDDFDTASDIIKGNIKISLGSLDDDYEADEREEARMEMLNELKDLKSELVKRGGGCESGKKEVQNEVESLSNNIDEISGDAVDEFSAVSENSVVPQLNNCIEGQYEDTQKESSSYGDNSDMQYENDGFGIEDDTADNDDIDIIPQGEFTQDNNDDFDNDDDNEFFPIDFDGDDEEPVEDDSSSIQDEIDRELAKYLVGNVGVDNSEQHVDKPKPIVDKPKPVVDKPKMENGKPKIVKTEDNKKCSGVTGNEQKKHRDTEISNTRGSENKRNKVKHTDIKIPEITHKINEKSKNKVDYSELTLKEINDRYLRRFMIENGVRKAPVKADILIKEFGIDLVKSFTTRGYIMKRGNGYIMGL